MSGTLRERVLRLGRHSVFQNATMLFIVSMLNYVMPLILVPYLARALGVELFGVYAFGMSIYLIGMILIDYGFPVQGLYAVAEHRDDPERVARLLGSMLAIKLGLFVLLAAALGAYAALNERFAEHRLFLLLMALPVLGGALQFRWVFQAVEQSGKIVRYLTIGRVVQVLLVVTLVSGPEDFLWVPIVHGLSMLLSGVLCMAMIGQLGYRFALPSWQDIRVQLREAWSYFLANVAEAQMGFAGIFSLSLVATPAGIAVYAVSEQLFRALRSLCHPLVDALMPYMKRSQDLRVFRKLCVLVFSLTAIGVMVGMLLAPHVIGLLFGARYAEATPILQIFLPGLLAFVPAIMIGYPLLASMGHGDQVSRIAVYAAIATVALLAGLWFIDALSGKTVALAIVTGEFLIFLGTMGLLWRVRAERRPATPAAPMEPG